MREIAKKTGVSKDTVDRDVSPTVSLETVGEDQEKVIKKLKKVKKRAV